MCVQGYRTRAKLEPTKTKRYREREREDCLYTFLEQGIPIGTSSGQFGRRARERERERELKWD